MLWISPCQTVSHKGQEGYCLTAIGSFGLDTSDLNITSLCVYTAPNSPPLQIVALELDIHPDLDLEMDMEDRL